MSAKTVEDLVPGDPEKIWLLASSYNRIARVCEEAGHGFRTTDVGAWYGRAAEAFHARFERQPTRFVALADSYLGAAVALDTYAAVLAWAQRQAGEVLELGDEEEPPEPAGPTPTITEQAQVGGVITGTGQPEPEPIRVDQRALALDTYRRALAMLDTVGNESATAIRKAAESIPGPLPTRPPAGRVVPTVVFPSKTWFDPTALRDDPRDWAVAIGELRRRLRWDGLNSLSPRLAQHLFEGHYRPSKEVNTGYHHREGGVDREVLRVVDIIAGPDPHGVYVGLVRGPRTAPTTIKKSTFFPDSWSRAEVLHAVRYAFLDAMRNKDTSYDAEERRFRAVYKGVRIVGHLRPGSGEPRLCDIVTAYPRGVRKRR